MNEEQKTIDKYSNQLSKEEFIELETDFFDLQGKSEDAIICHKKRKKNIYNAELYANHLSYLYLRNKDYRNAKRIAKEFLDTVSFNHKYDVLILNYEYASSKLESKIHKERIQSVLTLASDDSVKAVCNYLLGNKPETLCLIREHLSKNFQRSTSIISWAVFEDIREDLIDLKNQLARR